MMMTTRIVAAVLLASGSASVGLACDMPPLVVIPEKASADTSPQVVQQEFQKYYDAITAYTACVQGELDAAGGDSAQTIVKAVLVQRNNYAVAEAQAMRKVFDAYVGAAAVGPPASPAPAPAAEGEGGGRRRNR
jgi:hypothetical protein